VHLSRPVDKDWQNTICSNAQNIIFCVWINMHSRYDCRASHSSPGCACYSHLNVEALGFLRQVYGVISQKKIILKYFTTFTFFKMRGVKCQKFFHFVCFTEQKYFVFYINNKYCWVAVQALVHIIIYDIQSSVATAC